MKFSLILFLAGSIGCGASSAAEPVSGSGAVSGTVWQFAREGLPAAEVTLENSEFGIHRLMRTNDDGKFRVTGLVPAKGYKLKVSRQNFADWSSQEFEVFAGQARVFNITLAAESTAQKVAFPQEVPQVEQGQEGIGRLVTSLQANSLPARGHNLRDLALLAPTTREDRTTGAVAFPGRSPDSSLLMDGVLDGRRSSTEPTEALRRTSIDSIEALQVLSVEVPAEFGHSMGGVVNAISKSGSNALHGSAYGYFSNHSLSALDRYALGNNLFQNSIQSGIDFSAPLVKDKLFLFSSAEVLDKRYVGLNRITSPQLTSSGTAIDSSSCLASAAQCAAATAFLQNQMNVLVPRFEHSVSGLARLDYRRSPLNAISISASTAQHKAPDGSDYGAVAPNGGLIGNGLSTHDTSFGRFEWMTFPGGNVVNELRGGYFYDRVSTLASEALNRTGSVGIYVAGADVGATRAYPGLVSEERHQVADNFRFNFLTHTITIGGEYLNTRYRRDDLSNLAGTYYYPTLTAFAQDFSGGLQTNYSTFTQTLSEPIRLLPVKDWHIFVQDEWQPVRNFRFSAGVRLERSVPPQPSAVNATYYQTGTIPSTLSAAPRIGISYGLDDRTVVRLGFGYFHSTQSGELLDALFLGNGEDQQNITVTPDQTGAPVFPRAASIINVPSGSKNLMWTATHLSNPYARDLRLSLERSLPFQTTLTASYVGISGVHLLTANDLNLTSDVESATYTINDPAGQAVGEYTTDVWTTRTSTTYGHLYEIGNGGASSYRALSVQLRKPMARSLSFGATYTWAHAIDNVGGTLLTGGIPLNFYNGQPAHDRGDSAWDQRHRLVLDWIWAPRVESPEFGMARHLLNGWEISSITTLASSQPATAMVIVKGRQFSDIAMAFPTSLNGTGGWSRVPFVPIGSLHSQAAYVVNARLSRRLPITNRLRAKLLFEAFNLTNSQHDTGVNTIAYIANGGVLTPVSDAGAGNAANGYPNGSNARSCQIALRFEF